MEKLLETLIELARTENIKSKDESKSETLREYHAGKRDAYALSAKWIEEELINQKYEKMFEK